MTRILQIRRGDTRANNNFTGMAGELAFDTQAKTLRVHDGETLGGFELARRDQIGDFTGGENAGGSNNVSDFDINSVPVEFWENIVKTYAPKQFRRQESTLMPIGNVGYAEYIFNADIDVQIARAELVCQTPQAGYTIGDVVSAFGIGSRANPACNIFVGTDGVHVRIMIGSENFWVSNKNTGATTNITNARWKLRFVGWY